MQHTLSIPAEATKAEAIAILQSYISELNLRTGPTDLQKPWGAYFYIDPADTAAFIARYFPELPAEQLQRFGANLQPKFLLVEPGKRISWQYHHRRIELWKVVTGPVGVAFSSDDNEPLTQTTQQGELVQFDITTRHRLYGLDGWGVIAEIWQHTDPDQLSDEADIVRLADDYQR